LVILLPLGIDKGACCEKVKFPIFVIFILREVESDCLKAVWRFWDARKVALEIFENVSETDVVSIYLSVGR